MANKIITVYCADETIRKSSSVAGAAGSSNAVTLRLSFSAAWDGTTKKVYFCDATKAKSACIICTVDKLVSGETDVYDIPIPAEALDVSGKLLLTVKGVVVSGTTVERCMVSATTTMDVLPADMPSTDTAPVEPTPTQAEQLQSEIDGIKSDIATVAANASTIASSASAASASASAAAASQSAAAGSATAAAASQTAAKTSETNVASSASTATAKAGEASASASAAKTSETNAAASASTATTKADAASASASAAKTSETNARNAETAAGGSASYAAASQSTAAGSASAAAASQTEAKTSETNAAASAKAAAESAQQASTGQVNSDWNVADSADKAFIKNKPTALPASDVAAWAKEATKPAYTAEEVGADASGAASTALTAAKSYTDTKIEAIPAPDMSAKADKKVPAAAGNLATLDAGGNLADSGKKPADFAAATHASNHKTGGADALTAGDIGAYTKTEVDASLAKKAELNYTLYQRTMTTEQLNACSTYPYLAAIGTPSASFGPRPDYWDVEYHYYDANTGLQIITALVTGDRWYRVFNSGIAKAWQQIATCTAPTAYDLPLSNGWSADNFMKYMKSNGIVTIYGQVYSTCGTVNSETIVGTLPAGYRPSQNFEYPCTNDYGSCACLIKYGGSISVIPDNHAGTHFRIFASFAAGN